jgi:hypothetical protein
MNIQLRKQILPCAVGFLGGIGVAFGLTWGTAVPEPTQDKDPIMTLIDEEIRSRYSHFLDTVRNKINRDIALPETNSLNDYTLDILESGVLIRGLTRRSDAEFLFGVDMINISPTLSMVVLPRGMPLQKDGSIFIDWGGDEVSDDRIGLQWVLTLDFDQHELLVDAPLRCMPQVGRGKAPK